jgi:threonine/homoserine/homoserine lactone efflux protein
MADSSMLLMFGVTHFTAFLIAGILLNLTPGADTMYILGRSIAQGRKAGIYSALGIATGCLVHTLLAAFGLSMIIAQSQLAFDIVKYAGSVYLGYLGVKMLLAKVDKNFDMDESKQNSLRQLYVSGILTNVLNPKVALFFLAFLPQFVQTNQATNPVPFLLLGFTFFLTGTTWSLMLALFSSLLAGKIKANYQFKLWLNRITGGVFIALGIKLAFQTKQ